MAEKKKGPGRPAGSKNKTSKSSKTNKNDNSKAKEKAMEIQAKKKADRRVIDEIWAIIAIAVGIFLIVATLTDGAGQLGEIIGDFLKGLLGFVAYILPFYLIIFGILLFARQTVSISVKASLLAFVVLLMLATMNSVRFIDAEKIDLSLTAMKLFYTLGITLKSGGLLGMIFASLLIKWIGVAGCWIFTLVVTFICLLLIINTPVSRFLRQISDKIEQRRLIKENAHLDLENDDIKIVDGTNIKENSDKSSPVEGFGRASRAEKKSSILKYMQDDSLFNRNKSSGTFGLEEKETPIVGYGIDVASATEASASHTVPITPIVHVAPEPEIQDEMPAYKENKISNEEAKNAMLTKEEINSAAVAKKYKKPPVSLLEKPSGGAKTNSKALTEKAQKLEETLRNFHVDARVVQVTQGPTVTRYEIQPAVGVKVNSIVRLADDIALNLEAKSIRIEAPIPGKAAVGIEVENDSVNMVRIREIIDSQEFKESKSKITFAVGKDISGRAIVADLKSMPHLLIAGSTGSGKSVCINGIIASLLYKSNPDEVKLILIDPKVVELGNYNGVPHLMIPVVTDPSKAAAALNWAVAEMTDRYKKFAEEGVRDLESYNESLKANDEGDKVLPQVVIIIDELADLMMAAPSQIEESICRLAQMARAAGMHLIVATQRPSVDVITGVIKANIPSRIAFAVSSQVDSRTILDMQGAEKLVGKGDMLFNPMGMGKPVRIQGAFISDGEVNKIIDFVKSQVEDTDYNQEILTRIEKTEAGAADDDQDELLHDAIALIVSSGQASVSMLQRRFRIGYNRAARIMDMMEARGIVSAQDGSRPRQVLLSEEEFQQMENDIKGM